MRRVLYKIGILTFFLAWPAFYIYFKRMERTRILAVDDDRILVSKNWISDGKWSLPGGGLHKGEPIIQGAIREMYEETGIKLLPPQLRFMAKGKYRAYGLSFDFYCFVVRPDKPWKLSKQLHEVSDLVWIPYLELTTDNASQEVLFAIQAWRKS